MLTIATLVGLVAVVYLVVIHYHLVSKLANLEAEVKSVLEQGVNALGHFIDAHGQATYQNFRALGGMISANVPDAPQGATLTSVERVATPLSTETIPAPPSPAEIAKN